jgi:hydrogenase/urease accessory protein HupE
VRRCTRKRWLVRISRFFVFWVAGTVLGLRSASAPKEWRKLLISSAVLSILLPLSGLIYTGNFMVERIDSNALFPGVQAAGAAIGGGLPTRFMWFAGFFLGVALLVIDLLVGRDKQVV